MISGWSAEIIQLSEFQKFQLLKKIAFIVSHPIQYYAPLYRRLAARNDIQIKVFFTWHGGDKPQPDQGFGKNVAWDIPLTEGYDFEVVPNMAQRPGTHHFWGLRNPSLVKTVLTWRPTAVHTTGYAYVSHLQALLAFHRNGIPVLFRGDSHLLNGYGSWWRWQIKSSLLKKVFKWPAAFLCVGKANRDYYRIFGVPETKLFDCPHSIETGRFSGIHSELELQAIAWRRQLGIKDDQFVVLFVGKFEDKKCPVPLMHAFLKGRLNNAVLLMVGDGESSSTVRRLASRYPEQICVLPFQNQSVMPLVYRLGDVLVLPSAGAGETWGLVVNEAMACGRPALVSNRVGCHLDVICPSINGDVFSVGDWQDFESKLKALAAIDWTPRKKEIQLWSKNWSIEKTEETLVEAFQMIT